VLRLTTSASKISGHLDRDIEVLGLGLRETVNTRDVVGDGQVLRDDTSIASLIKIAHIWTSSISIDLEFVRQILDSRLKE
jgi:hypothetical protein